MPLGISESSIKAAYGPQDLSGIYKGIQNNINRLAQEEKLYRQQAIKEYSQDYNKLIEATKGIKQADASQITDKFNKWKTLAMRKANNSRFYDNTEDAMKSEGEIGSLFTDTMNSAISSKDKAKEHLNIWNDMKAHRENYLPNAMEMFKKEVIDMPTNYIVDKGTDDISKYVNPIPDYDKKIVDAFDKLSSKDVVKEFKPIVKIKGWVGRQDEYKDIPKYHSILGDAHSVLSNHDLNYNLAASGRKLESYIGEDGKLNDYGKSVIDSFNKILKIQSDPTQKDSRGLGLPSKLDNNFYIKDENDLASKVKSNKVNAAATMMAMERYVKDYENVTYNQGVARSIDPMAEKDWSKRLNLSAQEQYYDYTHPEGAALQGTDIDKLFSQMANTIENDPNTTMYKKQVVNLYNQSGYMPGDMKFITPKKSSANAEPDIYGYLDDYASDLGLSKGSYTNQQVADAMKSTNESNAYRGIEITPESIKNGRVVAFPILKSDKTVAYVYADPATKSGRNIITRETNKHIQTKKQEAGIYSSSINDIEEMQPVSVPTRKTGGKSTKFGGTVR